MLLDQHLLPGGGGPIVVALQHRSTPRRRDERLLRLLVLVLLLEEDLRDDNVAGTERLAGRFPRFGLGGRWRSRAVLQPGRQLRRAARAGTGYGRRARFGRSSTGGKLNF